MRERIADAACDLIGCMREDLNGDLRGFFFLIKETPEIISQDEVHKKSINMLNSF